MRLLHVIHSMNPANGGTTEAVRILVRHAQATHAIATVDSPGDPWVANWRDQLHALGPGKGQYGYSAALRDWLAENVSHYDAVIVHGLWQYPGVAARKAARTAGLPYFVYPHGMLDPWFKLADPLKHFKKSLVWPFADFRVMRDARAVLFTAEEEAVLARGSFRPYHCVEKISGLGVSAPIGDPAGLRESFFSAYPDLRGKRLVLFLGRIDPKKGLDLLIEAFGGSGDPWRLVLAGPFVDQAYHREMARLAEKVAARGTVAWTGMLAGNIKWGALSAADVFALPSHQENFGLAVAEALACGLPVLISNKVNIWREIEADGAGFVGSDDAVGTATTLRRWVDLDEPTRERMRANAIRCFRERFEINLAAQRFIETLKEAGV